MKKPIFLLRPFKYYAIGLAIESPACLSGNQIVQKQKPIRQHKKTGEVQAKCPTLVTRKADHPPHEVFVWKTLTPESGAECIKQVRHLTDPRNTGTSAVEKIIRLKREDFVAA